MRDIGVFDSIQQVWRQYPQGCNDGDVVTIGSTGVKYWWSAAERAWKPCTGVIGAVPPVPPGGRVVPPAGGCVPPPPVLHPGVTEHFGDLHVHGDLAVGGYVRGKVKQPNCGLFKTFDALCARYPHPEVGMWAVVGDDIPGDIYRCDVAGYWVATGEQGGADNIYLDDIETRLGELEEGRINDKTELGGAITSESEARVSGDATLRSLYEQAAENNAIAFQAIRRQLDILSEAQDDYLDLLSGKGEKASAGKYGIIDLGDVTTQDEVNIKLDEAFASVDLKYNGFGRIRRNGALIQTLQHTVNTASGFWAQAAIGRVTPNADGSALEVASKWAICVRWRDWDGRLTPWHEYGGGAETNLKTINGQSIVGEGNIVISAEGQINIDGAVSSSSNNAVSGRAVAIALAELTSGINATIASLTQRVQTTENNAQTAKNQAALLGTSVTAVEGRVTTLESGMNSLRNRVTALEGGSGDPSDPDGAHQGDIPDAPGQAEISIDTELDVTSPNAISNSAVAGALNNLADVVSRIPRVTVDTAIYSDSQNAVAGGAVANAIENLQEQIDAIPAGTGEGGTVNVDGVTIAQSAGVLKKADNAKTSDNVLGDVQVTGAVLPAVLSGNTRYNTYENITTGNATVDGQSVIELPAGSKIVPNGGMPQVPVTGGELSWVHSSDIGMIQDDESLTTAQRETRGTTNANILRKFVKTRFNLILDGTYYVHLPRTSNSNTGEAGQANSKAGAIALERELRIKGGGMVVTSLLFYVTKGGGIVCENVCFQHLENYPMIGLYPEGGVIGRVEMHGCEFKGLGLYISGRVNNVAPTDLDQMPRVINETNCKRYLGLTGDSRYKMKSATSSLPSMLYIYPEGETAPSSPTLEDCQCRYEMYSPLYVPYSGGDYVFKLDSSSITKHMGNIGTFILATDLESGDTTDGETYTIMRVIDTMGDDGIILEGNPAVARQGMEVFILDHCVFEKADAVTLGGIPTYTNFRISGCVATEIAGCGFNFGTANDMETGDEWGCRGVPMVIEDNIFRGRPSVVVATSAPYHCAVLAETDTVYFRRNLVENFISTTQTYDVYLSANVVEYTDNVVRNVLPFKPSASSTILYGVGKAKQVKLSKVYRNANSENQDDGPKRLSRVYERNTFVVSLKDVMEMTASHLASNFSSAVSDAEKYEVLKERCLLTQMQNVVATWGMEQFVMRNNVFDMPDVRVTAAGMSNGCVTARYFVFDDNKMSVRQFPNVPDDGYQSYMLGLYPLADGSTEISVCRNTFESKHGEEANLLCIAKNRAMASFKVEDNVFHGCGMRLTSRMRASGTTQYYDGPIQAETLMVRGNKVPAGLDAGFSGNYKSTGNPLFGFESNPVMLRPLAGGEHEIELWDSQERGTTASKPKTILLPNDGTPFTFRSSHMYRELTMQNGAPSTNNSIAFCLGYPLVQKGFCVTFRYCLRGVWHERKMEMRCGATNDSGESCVSLRGVDGRRYIQYNTGTEARYVELASIEELGLNMTVIHKAVSDSSSYRYLALMLHTGASGTLNDPGSEIEIRFTDAALSDGINISTGAIIYGSTSPMSDFLKPGTVMSSAERTALKTGDSVSHLSTSVTATRSTLLASDAGLWVIDDTSHATVVWNGTDWTQNSGGVVAMSGSEYQARLTAGTLDADTLYIVDESIPSADTEQNNVTL